MFPCCLSDIVTMRRECHICIRLYLSTVTGARNIYTSWHHSDWAPNLVDNHEMCNRHQMHLNWCLDDELSFKNFLMINVWLVMHVVYRSMPQQSYINGVQTGSRVICCHNAWGHVPTGNPNSEAVCRGLEYCQHVYPSELRHQNQRVLL